MPAQPCLPHEHHTPRLPALLPWLLPVARTQTLHTSPTAPHNHRFIFKDQYIEFTTNVPEDADLYGLGEVTLPTGLLLPRNGRTITMWSRDFPCAFPDVNLYGSHPFYLQVNKGMFRVECPRVLWQPSCLAAAFP